MTLPVHVTFRDLANDDALEALIRERAEALHATYDRLLNCRVLIEVPHRHHRSGNRYHVRIELSVPGDTLVVSHQPSLDPATRHADGTATKSTELDANARDAGPAVRDAFDVARRRLKDHAARTQERPHARS